MILTAAAAARDEIGWAFANCRAPRIRTMRRFAESEIIIPDGQYQGLAFRCERQPYTGLFFDAVDSGRWPRICATGPTQSGKTLCAYIVPLLYHLFEIQETVVCGLPDMDMAADKWSVDILPAIERSRYRDQIPKRGGGSRGGRVESVRFQNGQTLKFMSSGGGDKQRAGFTSRVLVITETDGMDAAGATSREADKITQMEGRLRSQAKAFQRIYMECTVSTEKGRTWQEYLGGTQSRIVMPCQHCRSGVCPEREHLVGWQDADTIVAAGRQAAWHCPACGEVWSEQDRLASNLAAKLVHRGEEIDDDGTIHGDPVETLTLGFRWSAVNNMFIPAGDVGMDEWRAQRAVNQDNAEKEMRQFVYALPYLPPDVELTPLTDKDIKRRVTRLPRGLAPAGTRFVTVGCDMGKHLAHYVVVAWTPGGAIHIVDYSPLGIESDKFGTEQGTLVALRELRDVCLAGWTMEGSGAIIPAQVWIDARWFGNKDAVYQFCREERSERFRPTMGYSATQHRDRTYSSPTKHTNDVRCIGDNYHLSRLSDARLWLVHVNADHWKMRVQERFKIHQDNSAGASIFYATDHEHTKFRKHLTSEIAKSVFIPERGEVIVFEAVSRENHYLDATSLGIAAGCFVESRLTAQAIPPLHRPKRVGITTPDGRPFLVTERRD
jgi:phage terminase large subunit GpA-like protein